MRAGTLIIAVLFLSAFAFAAGNGYDIEAFGDHSLYQLIADIKGGFIKDTGISLRLIPEFTIKGKGCAKGIMHAYSGNPERDAGLVCCELNENIVKEYNLGVYPVAREPLAIIVNKANPVNGITLEQARMIFSGRIANWKAVGGRDEKIVLITRLHCAEHTPNWAKILSVGGKFARQRLDVSSEPDMARTVSDQPQAIGHLEMTSIRLGHSLKVLRIDGHSPTSRNLRDGLYPLYATLSVVTKGEARGNVLRLIEYLRTSPGAGKAMEKYGMHQLKPD